MARPGGNLARKFDARWSYDCEGDNTGICCVYAYHIGVCIDASVIDRYLSGASQPDPCQSVTVGYDGANLGGFTSQNPYGHITMAQWGDRNNCIYGLNAYSFDEYYSYTTGGQLASRVYWIDEAVSGAPNGNPGEALYTQWTWDNEGRNTGYNIWVPGGE